MSEDAYTKVYVDRAEKLDKLRADPVLLEAVKVHYKNSPVDFINDWMMTYDPRVNPAFMPFLLFPKQVEFISWLHDKWKDKKDGLCEKSRDCGASWLSCAFAVWLFLFHPGQAIAFGSRKEDLVDKVSDPKSIFEKIRMIFRGLPNEFLPAGWNERKHAPFMKIMNPENDSTITGEAGDNIGRGGRSSIYFKDESAFYERPEKIEAALSMNSDVKIDISTPNGNGNPFYRKRFSGKIDVFTFHWKDDPRKDEEWYREQKMLLDPVIVAQEVDIDYNASQSNVLIEHGLVDQAMRNRIADVEPIGPTILGVDVARYGDDRSVIACRKGRAILWIEEHRQLDTMSFAGVVKNHIDEILPDAVFVDVVGIGSGVFDRLAEQYGALIRQVYAGSRAKNSKYFNKRAEMWCRMKDWFAEPPVVLPSNPDMVTDLCSLLYTFNSNGQYVLEKKEDAKRRGVKSPDIADAIALTFADTVHAYSWGETYDEFNYDEGRSAISGY